MPANVRGLPRGWYFITVSPELKLIEKLMMKLSTISQIKFGQARYWLIVVQQPIVIPSASLAANFLLCVRVTEFYIFYRLFIFTATFPVVVIMV
jgi:hypothetical protein